MSLDVKAVQRVMYSEELRNSVLNKYRFGYEYLKIFCLLSFGNIRIVFGFIKFYSSTNPTIFYTFMVPCGIT